jgi:hypothetical protein
MRNRILGSLLAFAVATAVMSSAPVAAAGQAAKGAAKTTASAKTWTPPRTPDGQPDLQGIWDNHSITPLERPAEFKGREFLTPEEAALLEKRAVQSIEAIDNRDQRGTDGDVGTAYNAFWWDRATTVVGTLRTSLVVDPPDGKIPPLTPEAQKRAAAEPGYRPLRATGGFEGGRGADSWFDRSLWERCITQGLPRLSSNAYNSNIQILQGPGYVAVFHEMIHEARVIPLDGRPHVGSRVRQYLGDSRGHWEGNTLVVDVTNFSDKTNFRGSTAGLHMVERFTRVDPDTLSYEVTFDDPSTWTKPWTAAVLWKRSRGQMYEYACHEGNYGMKGILRGAN